MLPDLVQSHQEGRRRRRSSSSPPPPNQPPPDQPRSPGTSSASVRLTFGLGARPATDAADCITLSSDEESGVPTSNQDGGRGEKEKGKVGKQDELLERVKEEKRADASSTKDNFERNTAGKRARENSSEENGGNVEAKKRAKKAKVARLFDSDSSDDENMARIKAGARLSSSSGGSLTQKVQ